MNEEYYIGQIFEGMYPKEAADWANANKARIVELDPVDSVRRFEIFEKPAPTPPTHEEVRQMRSREYQQHVDPITSHISRLRDMEQTEEVVAEIEELIAERTAKVAEIKERLPYPDEN